MIKQYARWLGLLGVVAGLHGTSHAQDVAPATEVGATSPPEAAPPADAPPAEPSAEPAPSTDTNPAPSEASAPPPPDASAAPPVAPPASAPPNANANAQRLTPPTTATAHQLTPPAKPEPVVSASAPVTDDAPAEEPPSDEDTDPMAWIGIGLKIGVASIGSSSLKYDNPSYLPDAAAAVDAAYMVSQAAGDMARDEAIARSANSECTLIDEKCTTSTKSRMGLQLALAITLGGDGFGWDLDPYINFADWARAYGVYTGPKFDIHVADPLYIGFGFGLKLAYVKAKDYDYAGDVYGRVPFRVTWYAHRDFALVGEFGIGYGGSGYVALLKDAMTGKTKDSDLRFGVAPTWDLTFGTRFP